MLEITESDLISFFEVLPEPQPDEEREFFDAPVFVCRSGGLFLSCSFSQAFEDFRVTMGVAGSTETSLDCSLKGATSISIEPVRNGRSWLMVKSRNGMTIAISVRPTIKVDIRAK